MQHSRQCWKQEEFRDNLQNYDVMVTLSYDHNCKFILLMTSSCYKYIIYTKINIYFSAIEKSQKTSQLDDERSQEASDNVTIQAKQKDEDIKQKIKEQESSKKFTYCVMHYNHHFFHLCHYLTFLISKLVSSPDSIPF